MPGCGFFRVRRAHEVAVLGDGVFAFEHLDHHGSRRHEIDQILEKRPFQVNRIKAPGFGRRQPAHLRGHDLETVGLEAGIDLADEIGCYRIGLDDGKRTFDGHACDSEWINASKFKIIPFPGPCRRHGGTALGAPAWAKRVVARLVTMLPGAARPDARNPMVLSRARLGARNSANRQG